MPNLRDPSWEPRRVYSLPDGTLETEDGHTVTIPPGDLPPSVVSDSRLGSSSVITPASLVAKSRGYVQPETSLKPLAAGSNFIFGLYLGHRNFLANVDTTNARALTDFSLKVDSNPTGTETIYDLIQYASISQAGRDGYRGTATLGPTNGVSIAVDTMVYRLARGVSVKRIMLTASAATTVRLRQAYGEPAGQGGGVPVNYELYSGTTSNPVAASMLPFVGITKPVGVVAGNQAFSVGLAIKEGFAGSYAKSNGNAALETINAGFQIIAGNYGISSTSAKTLALAAGVPVVLEFVHFASEFSGLRDFQMAGGAALGAAYGEDRPDAFKKIMLATAKSLICTTSDADSGIYCLPDPTYNLFMFMRDSFWTSIGMDDPEYARLVFKRFAGGIAANQVPTAFQVASAGSSAAVYSTSGGDNNMMFLLWAWWLRARYGFAESTDIQTGTQRNNAITGLVANVNASGQFAINVSTMIGSGWMDNYIAPGSLSHYSSANLTGLAAAALQAGQNFSGSGFLPTATITAAQAAYRSFFNGSYLNFVIDDVAGGTITDSACIDVSALAGEFFNLLLFNAKILTDAQVSGHLDAIFAHNIKTLPTGFQVMKNIVQADGTYLPTSRFSTTSAQQQVGGNYDNGGSWLLWDFIACAVGKAHGYTNQNLDAWWSQRRQAEFAVDAVSHEYLNCEAGGSLDPQGSCHHASFGNGWNALAATCEDIFGLQYQPVTG